MNGNRIMAMATLFLLTGAFPGWADVTLDGTMGPAGAVAGPEYDIRAEYGRQSGGNLFHSFGRFSVGAGERATFSGPGSVSNIIGRVTGGDLSRIDGTLRSTISGADLFLLNPAGVIFGAGASLDLTGAFHVGAADALNFSDGNAFSAFPAPNEILSAAPPSAFGFLDGGADGEVRIEGDLSVPAGESLTVAGRDVTVSGSLSAPDGRVRLDAVAGPGEAPLGIEDDPPPADGDVILAPGASVDVSGDGGGTVVIRGGRFYADEAAIWAETYGDVDGGRIDIETGDGGVTLDGGSLILTDTEAGGDAADVTIRSDGPVTLTGFDADDQSAAISANAWGEYEDAGDAGDVTVESRSGGITVTDGAAIETASYGVGAAGAVTLEAAGAVSFSGIAGRGWGARVRAGAETRYSGDAGDVTISADRITLSDGALIDSSTFGPGRGGEVRLTAQNEVIFSGTDADGLGSGVIARTDGSDFDAGDAGNVSVTADSLTLSDGGWIGNTSSGPGRGGDVTVEAAGVVRFEGVDGNGDASRIYTTALGESEDAGNAGDVRISAGSIEMTDGGGVTASTSGPGRSGAVDLTARETIRITGVNPEGATSDGLGSGVYARSRLEVGEEPDDPAGGDAGNITLSALTIVIEDGAAVNNSTWGAGDAGDIGLNAETVTVSGGGTGLFSRSESWEPAGGDGGSITVAADRVSVTHGATVGTASYGGGRGGDVTITATGPVGFSGLDDDGIAPAVFTRAEGEETDAGDAGNIRIEGRRITLGDGGLIESASYGGGGGGDLTLVAGESVTLSGTEGDGSGARIAVGAETSYARDAGRVTIETGDLTLNDGAFIDSLTFGTGRGGDVSIAATGTVRLAGIDGDGLGSGIIARADGADEDAGRGGDVTINAAEIRFDDGGWIGNTSDGGGRGGDVTITAAGAIHFGGVDGDGYASQVYTSTLSDEPYAKEAGDITLSAGSITFTDGAGLTASTRGQGDAGRIEVRTPGTLRLEGGNPHGENRDGYGSGLYARATGTGPDAGTGGRISVSAGNLVLADGGLITSSTEGAGKGGDVVLDIAGTTQIEGIGTPDPDAEPRSSQTDFLDDGGTPADAYPSGIYAGSTGPAPDAGAAGVIRLTGDEIRLSAGGRIATSADNAGGGAMTIRVNRRLYLLDGRITTSVALGAGDGGDVTIDHPRFVILNGAEIIARAWEGTGGNISIAADHFIRTTDSVVDASSRLGIDGVVEIASPEVDVSGGLAVLPTDFLDAAQWLATPCAARSGESVSRFVISGRDGVPPPYDGVLGSPYAEMERTGPDEGDVCP